MLIVSNGGASLYDPLTDTWSATNAMNQLRTGHAAVRLQDGRVLVTGGVGDGKPCEVYSPITNSWTVVDAMNTGRANHAALLLAGGRVLVAGGTGTIPLNSAEVWDPTGGTGGLGDWAPTGSLSTRRTFHTGAPLPNGQVLLMGGQDDNGNTLASTDIYDPLSGTWAPGAAMHEVRREHASSVLLDGRVLVVGGRDDVNTSITAEVFDSTVSAQGSWSFSAAPAYARYGHTATTTPTGDVVITGGIGALVSGGTATFLNAVEVVDASLTWRIGSPMLGDRVAHRACVIDDGRVLVVGGSNSTGSHTAELYHLASDTWVPAGTMVEQRDSHSASRLDDGSPAAA